MEPKEILKTLRRTKVALNKLLYTHGGYGVSGYSENREKGTLDISRTGEIRIFGEEAAEYQDPVARVTLEPRKIFEKRRLRVNLPRLYEPQIHPSKHMSPDQIRLNRSVETTLFAIAPTLPKLTLQLGKSVLQYYHGNLTDAYQVAETIVEILENSLNK